MSGNGRERGTCPSTTVIWVGVCSEIRLLVSPPAMDWAKSNILTVVVEGSIFLSFKLKDTVLGEGSIPIRSMDGKLL